MIPLKQFGLFTSFALVLAATATSRANLIAQDSFLTGSNPAAGEYVVGQPLYSGGVGGVGVNPTVSGFQGAWINGSWGEDTSILGSSLSYSSPGYAAPVGGALTMGSLGKGERVGRQLDASINPFSSTTNGTFYISFLLQRGTDSGYQALEINTYTGGFVDTNRAFQLGASEYGDFGGFSGSNFGFRANDNGALVGDLGVAADTNVHLFVVRFDLSSTSFDSITGWIDPNISSPGSGVTISGFNLANADSLLFGQFGANSMKTDEFRMGTTFADVTTTAVPEPQSLAFLIVGLCCVCIVIRRRRPVA